MGLFEVVGYEERYVLSHGDKTPEAFKQDCLAAAEAIFEREARDDPTYEPTWAWANAVAEWLCTNCGYAEIRAPRGCVVHDAIDLLHPAEVARRARRS